MADRAHSTSTSSEPIPSASRRLFLGTGSAVAVCAVLKGAVASAASSRAPIGDGPDAELFALREQIEEADRMENAAIDAVYEVEEVYDAARPPEPQFPQPPKFDYSTIDWPKEIQKLREREKLFPPDPQIAIYDAAHKSWEAECDRLRAESGLKEAEEIVEGWHAAVGDIREQLVAIRATTIEGLRFKAAYAASHFPTEYDEQIMISIVDNLLVIDGAS